MVRGAVNSPGAVAFEPGKNLDWYVDRAGGYTQTGDNDHPYVTQPNGEREGVKRRMVLADRVPNPDPGSGGLRARPRHPQDRSPANLPTILGTVAQVLGAADDHHRGRHAVTELSSRAKRGSSGAGDLRCRHS